MKIDLSPEVFNICWKGGTEPPFSGKYNKHYEKGSYHCVCCDHELFRSETKFDSGSGWPSFWETASSEAITQVIDNSHNMTRMEVRCKNCGAHLGHVFEDGPQPTGKRYCINSLALTFKERSFGY